MSVESKTTKFRKKQIEVEAEQINIGIIWSPYTGYRASNPFGACVMRRPHQWSLYPVPMIKTLEGWLTVSPNDWIIKGLKGEFYPCKPDIFEATYDRI